MGSSLKIRVLAAIFVFVAVVAPAAHAAERVTLRNGFEMNCSHHGPAAGHIRLYLSTGEDNYVEFRPEEISNFEFVPDPPPDPAPATLPAPGTAVNPEANPDARLSPADLREMLAKAGHAHNLDVDLLASLVKAESGGNSRAVSRAGARGLMQLMPKTASDLGVEDSFKPEQNVRGGSTYLNQLLALYHDNLTLALAAYNAGPQAVAKYHGIPPYRETRAYVAYVIHEFNRRVLAREALARRAVASAPHGQ